MYGICSTWAFAALYDYTIVNYNFFMFRFTVCTNWAVKDKLVFSAESYADTFLSLLKSKPKNIMHAVHVQCSCSTECDHSPNIYFFGRKSKWDCGISLGCGCGHYPPFICHDLCLISVSQAMFVLRALFFRNLFHFFLSTIFRASAIQITLNAGNRSVLPLWKIKKHAIRWSI